MQPVLVAVLAVVVLSIIWRNSGDGSPPAISRPPKPPADSMKSQRDTMRQIAQALRSEEDVIAAYAAAERAGRVQRKSNDYKLSPEEYARRLYADGVQKGWLTR